ncbi:MAG: EAL domain-containing protein [Novosphingobium sp.]|nr:EAL domain-containing protein [Novosphingobium sp.]
MRSSALGGELESGISLHAYKAALDNIANVMCTDQSGNIVYANEHFCQINKCTLEQVLGENNRIFNSGHHPPEFFRDLWTTIASGNIWRGEICNRALDGTVYWVDTKIAPRYDHAGDRAGYVALRLDITARKQAEAEAIEENRKRRETEMLLNDIVATLPNGVVAYDADGKVSFFNKAHKEIYAELSRSVEVGRRRKDLVQAGDHGVLLPLVRQSAADPLSCQDSFLQHLPGDRWVQVQNRKSQSGTLVSVQTDVTELKRAEQQIAFQAQRDSLTGTLNRNALLSCLAEATGQDRGKTCPLTFVLLDLDDFKAINDGLGHDAGDELLCHVADCLQSAVRCSDTVARVGGDEFAILLKDTNARADIKRVLEKLRAALAAPVRIGGKTIVASSSIGVAVFPRDGDTPDKLMKCADLALYRCKRESRSGYKIYSSSMRRQHIHRTRLTEKLSQALARDEFCVVLQPQCDIGKRCHTGFEALVRWKVGRRWVPPEELISIAEEVGLISQVSYRIMDKALAMMARFKQAGLAPGVLGINVVAAQLHEPSFVKTLLRLLKTHGIAPSELEIEVTENVILDRSASSIARVLQKLHAEGVSIALDDFGMGYASLTHLKRFPLNRLKIDRSFVAGMLDDQDDHVIVRTVISLAHNLGLQVVAEGVETPEQYRELLGLGCDAVQGFLIGRPMDEESAARHCRQSGGCCSVIAIEPGKLALDRNGAGRGTRAGTGRQHQGTCSRTRKAAGSGR